MQQEFCVTELLVLFFHICPIISNISTMLEHSAWSLLLRYYLLQCILLHFEVKKNHTPSAWSHFLICFCDWKGTNRDWKAERPEGKEQRALIFELQTTLGYSMMLFFSSSNSGSLEVLAPHTWQWIKISPVDIVFALFYLKNLTVSRCISVTSPKNVCSKALFLTVGFTLILYYFFLSCIRHSLHPLKFFFF